MVVDIFSVAAVRVAEISDCARLASVVPLGALPVNVVHVHVVADVLVAHEVQQLVPALRLLVEDDAALLEFSALFLFPRRALRQLFPLFAVVVPPVHIGQRCV